MFCFLRYFKILCTIPDELSASLDMSLKSLYLFLGLLFGLNLLHAEDSVEESFSKSFPSGDIESIRVGADRSEVNVIGEYREDVYITWKIDYRTESLEKVSDERAKIEYDAQVRNKQCLITLKYGGSNSGWSWVWGDKAPGIEIEVRVPEAMDVVVKTSGGEISVENIQGMCDLKTSGGRIELEGIVGNVKAKTSGGRIDVESVDGDLDIASSGGAIDVDGVTGTVNAQTSGGSISIEGGSGQIVAETTGGSISVECPDPSLERLDLNTMGGSIRIELAKSAGGSAELKTQGGSVSIDNHWAFDGEKKRSYANGAFGSGKTVVRAYTLGGSVRLDTL